MLHHSLTAKEDNHRLDFWDMLDKLDGLGLTGIQLDPSHYRLLPGDDETALKRLDEVTRRKGYYVEFGMGGWDTRLEERIRLTARFGGRAVRTFISDENCSVQDLVGWMRLAAPRLREAGRTASEHNVYIGVENHGDFTSVQLEEMLRLVDHPRVGACLDTGNSLFRKEDPLECAKRLAPWAVSMHLKDWFMSYDAQDRPHWREAPLGKGQVPVVEILRLVAKYHPDLYIALESPPRPLADEAETVKREWEHLTASAAAAREILADL